MDQRYYAVGMGRFGSADPSRGSSAGDPGSWNKYTCTQGDPVNFNDSAGLNRLMCDVYTNEGTCAGGGGGGRGTLEWVYVDETEDGGGYYEPVRPTPTEPAPPSGGGGGGGVGLPSDYSMDDFRNLALAYARAVSAGQMTDCMALSYFADDAASLGDLARFNNAFRVMYSSDVGGYGSGVGFDGKTSGFQPQYQEGYPLSPTSDDQVHHFAFFLNYGVSLVQGGALLPAASVGAAAVGLEVIQGTPSNIGDINLGVAAGMIGVDVASTGSMSQVGNKIRSTLCKH